LASCVEPGESVLYLGANGDRFFKVLRVHRPTSRSARTIFHSTLDGQTFEVVVVRSILEVMTARAGELLGPNGRLIIAIRPIWSGSSAGYDGFEAMIDLLPPERLANPYSAIDRVASHGYLLSGQHHRWSAGGDVFVFKRTRRSTPEMNARGRTHSANAAERGSPRALLVGEIEALVGRGAVFGFEGSATNRVRVEVTGAQKRIEKGSQGEQLLVAVFKHRLG
jgi:hypothetical protein